MIGKLRNAIKILLERDAQRSPEARGRAGGNGRRMTNSSIISVMLFTSQDGLDTFTSVWEQTFEHIEYPAYGPVDLFAILSYHYPQKASAMGYLRTQSLAVVIEDELVKEAWGRDKSLKQITEDLEKIILDLMEDWDRVTTRLSHRAHSSQA
jgi:hypothetical protein